MPDRDDPDAIEATIRRLQAEIASHRPACDAIQARLDAARAAVRAFSDSHPRCWGEREQSAFAGLWREVEAIEAEYGRVVDAFLVPCNALRALTKGAL